MTKKTLFRLDIILGVIGLILGFMLLPAHASDAAAVAAPIAVDPAQQDFLARILIFVGTAMINHAHDWAGYALLAFPILTKIVGWLMPREWLFAIARTAASPAVSIFKMLTGGKK